MILFPHPLRQLIFCEPRNQLRPGSFLPRRKSLGTRLDNNCIKNIWSLASSIKEIFPGSKIGISSITVRHDADLTDRISTVNKQLQELCVKNGFDFINNSNVDNTCLNGSQLHLNAKESAFVATNFIKFLRGSNANVKSSYRSRRNEDFRRTRPARFHLLEDLLRLMSIS
jgi:hypothetical protein